MAISYKGVGSWATNTSTSQTVTLPTHAAGDMLIVRAIRKPYSGTNMSCGTSGWNLAGTVYTNGTTANGTGVGSMMVATFYKVATSSSETSPVITWGATAAPGACVAVVYQKGSSDEWATPTGVGGINSTAATTVNDTLGTHIAVAAGDMVDFWMGWCDDSGTPSAASISQPGVTYTVTGDIPATALDTSTSNDMAADGGYALATAGTSSGAATITANFGSSEQHVVWMTRLRVTTPPGGTFTANAVIKRTQYGGRPFIRSVGTGASGTTSLSMTIPAAQDGDLLVAIIESYGYIYDYITDDLSTDGVYWAQFTDVSSNLETTGDTYLATYIARKGAFGGSETTASMTMDTMDHAYGVVIAIGGVGGGLLWEDGGEEYGASGNATNGVGAASTTVEFLDYEHYWDNALLLYVASNPADASTARFSAWTPANLTDSGYEDDLITEVYDAGTTTGNGGGIGIAYAYPGLDVGYDYGDYIGWQLTGVEATQASNVYASIVLELAGFTLDAEIEGVPGGLFTADALIQKTSSGSLSADAVIMPSFTLDAVIFRPEFTLDACIYAPGPQVRQHKTLKLSDYWLATESDPSIGLIVEDLYPSSVGVASGSPTLTNTDATKFPGGDVMTFQATAPGDAIDIIFDSDIWLTPAQRAGEAMFPISVEIGLTVTGGGTGTISMGLRDQTTQFIAPGYLVAFFKDPLTGADNPTANTWTGPTWSTYPIRYDPGFDLPHDATEIRLRLTSSSSTPIWSIDYVKIHRVRLQGVCFGRIMKIPITFDEPTLSGSLVMLYRVRETYGQSWLEDQKAGGSNTSVAGIGGETEAGDLQSAEADGEDPTFFYGWLEDPIQTGRMRFSHYQNGPVLSLGDIHFLEIVNAAETSFGTLDYSTIFDTTISDNTATHYGDVTNNQSRPSLRILAGWCEVYETEDSSWTLSASDATLTTDQNLAVSDWSRQGRSVSYLGFSYENDDSPVDSNPVITLSGYSGAQSRNFEGWVISLAAEAKQWQRGFTLDAEIYAGSGNTRVAVFQAAAVILALGTRQRLLTADAVIHRVQGQTFDSQVSGASSWWKFDDIPTKGNDNPTAVEDHGSAGADLNLFGATEHAGFDLAWCGNPDPRFGNRGVFSTADYGIRIDRADISDLLPVGNSTRTFEFWYRDKQPADATVFAYGNYLSSNGEFGFMFSNSSTNSWVRIIAPSSGGDIDWGSPDTANGYTNDQRWHHYAITYDGSGRHYELFYDGASQGVKTGGVDLNTTGDGLYFIGSTHWLTWADFEGALSNLVVYDSVLPRETIAAHAASSEWLYFTVDAELRRGFKADAWIHFPGGSFTADAALVEPGTLTFTTDAVIRRADQLGSLTAGAILGLPQSSSLTVDAVILKTIYSESFIQKLTTAGATHLWGLGETGTTAEDTIGAKDGTYTGASLTKGVDGPPVINGARGVVIPAADGNYIAFANGADMPSANADRTVIAWVKTTRTAASAVVGWGDNSTARQFVLILNYSGDDICISSYITDVGVAVTDNEHVDGNWHCIVISYTGATYTFRVLFDGEYIGNANFGSARNTYTTGMRIGALYYANGYYFGGTLSNIAILPSAVSDELGAYLTRGDSDLRADAVISREQSNSLTADAVLKLEQPGSFSADAVIGLGLVTVPGDFTAAAVVKTTSSASLTADAVIKATSSTKTLTADAVQKATISSSFTANAVLLRGSTGVLTENAVLLRVISSGATANAVLEKTQSSTLTAAATIAAVTTNSFFANAIVRKSSELAFTANALVRTGQSSFFLAAAVIRASASSSFLAASVILDTAASTASIDAIISSTAASTFSSAAVVRKTSSLAFVADALVRKSFTSAASLSAIVRRAQSGSFAVDAWVEREQTGSFTANAALFKLLVFTADAIAKTEGAGSFSANAWVLGTNVYGLGSYAVIWREQAGQLTADAAVRRTTEGSRTLNAVVHRTSQASLTTDAIVLRQGAGSFIVAAVIRSAFAYTFVADAVVRRTRVADSTASAVILRSGTGSLTTDAILRRTSASSLTGDAVVRAIAFTAFLADAVTRRPETGTLTTSAIVARTASGPLTGDAVALRTQTGSLTADAWVQGSGVAAFALDAVITRTASGAFTANAVSTATLAGNFTASAVSMRTVAGTFVSGAVLASTETGSLLGNAVVRRAASGSIGADATIRQLRVGSLTTDAIVLRAEPLATIADAILFAEIGGFITAQAWLSGTFTADAITEKENTGSLSADAVVMPVFSADAVLRRSQEQQFTANAWIPGVGTFAFVVDSTFRAVIGQEFTSNSVTRAEGSGTITASSAILAGAEQAFTADAVAQKSNSSDLTADAVVVAGRTVGFGADAVLLFPETGSALADAVLLVGQGGSASTDATLRSSYVDEFTADALALAPRSGSATADAYLFSASIGAFTGNAVIHREQLAQFLGEALVQQVVQSDLGADATIQASHVDYLRADGAIQATLERTFKSDAVTLNSFSNSVNSYAVIHRNIPESISADAEIRDRTAFTADAVISGATEFLIYGQAIIVLPTGFIEAVLDLGIIEATLSISTPVAFIEAELQLQVIEASLDIGFIEAMVTGDFIEATISQAALWWRQGSFTASATLES